MTTASKIALTVAMAMSAGIISYVHYKQTYDRSRMHEGVLRDIERQRQRKLEGNNLSSIGLLIGEPVSNAEQRSTSSEDQIRFIMSKPQPKEEHRKSMLNSNGKHKIDRLLEKPPLRSVRKNESARTSRSKENDENVAKHSELKSCKPPANDQDSETIATGAEGSNNSPEARESVEAESTTAGKNENDDKKKMEDVIKEMLLC